MFCFSTLAARYCSALNSDGAGQYIQQRIVCSVTVTSTSTLEVSRQQEEWTCRLPGGESNHPTHFVWKEDMHVAVFTDNVIKMEVDVTEIQWRVGRVYRDSRSMAFILFIWGFDRQRSINSR